MLFMTENLSLKISSKRIFKEFFAGTPAIIRHLKTQILPHIKNSTSIRGWHIYDLS